MTKFKEFVLGLDGKFKKGLERKTSWGKHEVYELFCECVIHSLVEIIKCECEKVKSETMRLDTYLRGGQNEP